MKKVIIISILVIFPLHLFAYSGDVEPQAITVTISKDGTAKGVWQVPLVLSRSVAQIFIPEFRNFGTGNTTRYKLESILNEKKEKLSMGRSGNEEFWFNPGALDKNTGTSVSIQYSLTSAFTNPVAIYEFFIADGAFKVSPSVNVTYPKGWKPLSVWPANSASTTSNTVTINYPSSYPDSKPVLVAFQTNTGTGVVETFGKYTISGSKDEIQKVKTALGKLGFIDDLMLNSIGLKTPDSVLIVIDDLTKADEIGYEAEAVAVRPNIVIFNNRILSHKTSSEIAETLAHEFTHLSMYNLELFQNRNYSIPWFTEGVAVFMQTLSHNKIFTDTNEKILNEELNKTWVVSPKEASVLYETNFDFDFAGNRTLGTGASYSHSGIVFSNFYDKKGVAGFKDLFKQLATLNVPIYEENFSSDAVLRFMKSISGLNEKDLLYPGKSNNAISEVVGKIEHVDNNEDVAGSLVLDYINKTKHYFVSGPVLSKTPVKVVVPTKK